MKKYHVDFQTGVELREADTLEEAMEIAVEGISFTQKSILIFDENQKEVASLPWWGVEPEEDDIVTEQFGSFGFYGEWITY